jgi:hypothetical protein
VVWHVADPAMVSPRVYVVGSLRQPEVVISVTNALTAAGCRVFSDWCGAGPEADDYWQKYEKARGRTYREALKSPAAQNVFKFDLRNILIADMVVMVMPAGKSGHLEIGFAAGCKKPTFILMDEPGQNDRWDVMTLFAGMPIDEDDVMEFAGYYREPGIAYNVEELITMIQEAQGRMVMDTISDNPTRPV